ncbi:MAG: lamin tail domain-containing protein [Myxococcaceae bacterium]
MQRAFAVGLVAGVLVAISSCGSSATCDPSNCSGCCDSSGSCRPGTAADVCGKGGLSCSACGTGQTCSVGACSTGGGSAAGGGSASGGGAAAGGGAATGGGAAAGGGAATGGGAAAGGGAATGGGAGSGAVVFNEICARGSDFLELMNTGSASADLGGYAVADSIDDGGGAKLDSALVFPSGTSLAPGDHLLVVLNVADAGLTTDCLDGGPSSCFGATFKVSNSRGEVVWLLAPGGGVVQQQLYPMDAVPSGFSYGRLPDGTGSFGQTTPTPGHTNM